jgi:hypothetical protein
MKRRGQAREWRWEGGSRVLATSRTQHLADLTTHVKRPSGLQVLSSMAIRQVLDYEGSARLSRSTAGGQSS